MARLSESQRTAVEDEARPLCVIAGAGSGKTSVLTLRVAVRVRSGTADADHTMVCTFTRKAAAELRERLLAFGVPVSVTGPGRIPTPGVRAGTLHQLALSLIRRHCLDAGRPVPVVVEHRSALVRPLADGPGQAAVLGAEIGWAKARGLTPDGYRRAVDEETRHVAADPDTVTERFRAYEEALARRGALDLDDLLLRAAELLATDVGFAERMRWRYRHFSVDEFQDVNPAQFRLLQVLLGDARDLTVVGDPHQAIYGWNGADPTLLDRLPELLGPLGVRQLADNHRSTPPIVELADAVLGKARRYRARSVLAGGPDPVIASYDDEHAEADGVADGLLARHAEGVPWSEHAVLARTHDQLAVLARGLGRAGIPHRMARADDGFGRATGAPASADAGRVGAVDPASADVVELATFHRAKGAEWTSVFVTGVEDGLVPIAYAETDEARAEERRLLYVACTRAGRYLECSWARRRTTSMGRIVERSPSPWLPVEGSAVGARTGAGGRSAGPVVADRIAGLRAALERRP